MIYIDPPYNTKNTNFIYKDNYKTHTKYINEMYPRLKLARNLLKQEGLILISIDENEIAYLKIILDEIYGETNHIGTIIRKTNFNNQHEYLLIYSKNYERVQIKGEHKQYTNYKNPDNDTKGDWTTTDPTARNGTKTTYYPITNPYTKQVDYPPNGRYWAFNKTTLQKHIQTGKIKFRKKKKKNTRGFIYKRYKQDINQYNPVNSLFACNNNYLNKKGTEDLKRLFNNKILFEYPKPVKYIMKLIQYFSNNNDIILDFYAGSSTTGEAVLRLNNKQKTSNRKFILIQQQEKIRNNHIAYKEGYKDICDIGITRITKTIQELEKNTTNKIGFKIYKLIKD